MTKKDLTRSQLASKLFIFAFLTFSVLHSKDVLIYNEETGIALSFLAFISYILYFFGKTTKESLQEKSDVILAELQNSGKDKQNIQHRLVKEHLQVTFNGAFSHIDLFTSLELRAVNVNQALNSYFSRQIQQKIKTSFATLQPQFQHELSGNISGKVYRQLAQKDK